MATKVNYKLIIIALILFLPIVLFALPSKVHAVSDTYPYPSSSPDNVDPWGFYNRNCTSYVSWKQNETGTNFYNGMQGPNGNYGVWGNGGNWDNNASTIGYAVTSTPQIGAIAVWDPNEGGAGSVGHVAVVENVNANSTVDVSEYNWDVSYGFGQRYSKTASHYVIIRNNGCGGANVILNNQTISGGTFICSATQTITILPEFSALTGSEVQLYIN